METHLILVKYLFRRDNGFYALTSSLIMYFFKFGEIQ